MQQKAVERSRTQTTTEIGLMVIQIRHRRTRNSSEKAQISGKDRDLQRTQRNAVPHGPARRRFSLGLNVEPSCFSGRKRLNYALRPELWESDGEFRGHSARGRCYAERRTKKIVSDCQGTVPGLYCTVLTRPGVAYISS